MLIKYSGTITKQDFLKCIMMLNPNLKWQKWFSGIVLGVIAISFIYLWLDGSKDTIQPLLDYGPTALIPVVVLLFPWWMPYLQATSYNQKTNIYRSEVFGTLDDQETTISNGEVKAAFQWSAFIGYKIDKEILLMRQSKYGFIAFKPNMFSSRQDWEELVTLAKSKILVK
jgi:hypothetical protein